MLEDWLAAEIVRAEDRRRAALVCGCGGAVDWEAGYLKALREVEGYIGTTRVIDLRAENMPAQRPRG